MQQPRSAVLRRVAVAVPVLVLIRPVREHRHDDVVVRLLDAPAPGRRRRLELGFRPVSVASAVIAVGSVVVVVDIIVVLISIVDTAAR